MYPMTLNFEWVEGLGKEKFELDLDLLNPPVVLAFDIQNCYSDD